MSDSLQPHGLQHVRLPWPSPTPIVYSNSCPLSWWCHPTISSSVVLFSSCSQSFPASESFWIRWPKSWSFSFNISPSSEYSGLISFRMDWLDLLAVQGTLKSLLQQHTLWSMWSDSLVFCDCGFLSVSPLMEKDKRLMEASWWERMTEGNTELNQSWLKSLPFSLLFSPVQFSHSSVSDCDLMDCSMQGIPVHHQLPELPHTHVHRVSDAIQASSPLLSLSLPAFNLSQYQGLLQWVSSLHQVAKVLELQLQHQSFQWIFRTDFL